MKQLLRLIKNALYGEQTSDPIADIMEYVERQNTNNDIESAQLATDINNKIKELTTNPEVISARAGRALLSYRLNEIENEIKYLKKLYNFDDVDITQPVPRNKHNITFIVEDSIQSPIDPPEEPNTPERRKYNITFNIGG